MAQFDPKYTGWLADHMWKNGYSLFADAETEEKIRHIAYQMSVSRETEINKAKYKGNLVYLLYVGKNYFPIVPTRFFYEHIEPVESDYLRLTDAISAYKGMPKMSGSVPLSCYCPEYIDQLPLTRINQYCRRCPEHLDKLCEIAGDGPAIMEMA